MVTLDIEIIWILIFEVWVSESLGFVLKFEFWMLRLY